LSRNGSERELVDPDPVRRCAPDDEPASRTAPAVEKIGTSSFTSISVISTATHRCATVRTVQVVLNADRSGSRPWTAEERAALTQILATA
jgi:hypothetical protein